MEQQFYDDLYRKIVKECNIPLFMEDIPVGIEISSRENEKAVYIFIQNFSDKDIELPLSTEMYTSWGGKYRGTLHKFGTVILKKEKEIKK